MGHFNEEFSCFLKDGMGLMMKNFNIMGVHWKIRYSGMGVTKNQYTRGGGGALGQFADLRGPCRRRGGGVFEGKGGLKI